MTWQIKQSDVWNWTESWDCDGVWVWVWVWVGPEIEDAALVCLPTRLVCLSLWCVVCCVCVCLWCECYGNLLSSAYTKLETRKALGNLHESCPQTALQAVRGSGRGSTPQRQRQRRREGDSQRGAGWGQGVWGRCEVSFWFSHPNNGEQTGQRGNGAHKRLLLSGGHMWQLYWIPIHTQSYLAARLANRYESWAQPGPEICLDST